MTGAVPLLTARDRQDAARLVQAHGLTWEDVCDDVVGIYDAERLVATAARAGYVLKMFAIDEAAQGTSALGELATALMDRGRAAGHESFFVFTRPEHANSFAQCNFRLLVSGGGVALLEFGGGFERYVAEQHEAAARHGRKPEAGSPKPDSRGAAAVVLNANPFTRGHQYLVETAASRVERLYVFVVREDRSIFPFAVRDRLVRAGTAHLANVAVLDTGRYAVSAGTFPSYFLRARDNAALMQMEVDVRLFGACLAPAFGIGCRFVGHEPYCETTAAYNDTMRRVLPEYGVTLEEIPRLGDANGFISATRVRAALADGRLDEVAWMLPETTAEYLRRR